jgi:hypothetical protein
VRHRFLLALLPALAATVIGCSTIPLQEEAQGVEDVPPDFLETTTTTVEETVPEDSGYTLALYFLNADNQLVRVERDRTEPATVQEAIDSLAQTPLDEEKEANPGIEPRLLVGLEPLADPRTESGTIPIRVAGDDLRLATQENNDLVFRIYRQIICTLVALDETITSVQINDATGIIRVQTQDGSVVEGPVTPDNVDGCKTAAELAAEAAEEGEGASTTEG